MRDLLLDALAVYRGTRLVTADSISRPGRERVIRFAYEARTRKGRGIPGTGLDSWDDMARSDDDAPPLAELVTCPHCTSVWIAFGVVLAHRFAPRLWDPLAKALAYSAVTGLIASRED